MTTIASRYHKYSTLLIITGVLVILYPLLTEVYGYYLQYQLKQEWEREARIQTQRAKRAGKQQERVLGRDLVSREDLVLKEALFQEAPLEPKPFPPTKIIIPKIGLEQVVLEGVDTNTLKNGPGHYPGMVNPGEKGNVGIAGHRVTYTRPFNRIDELVPGDPIILETIDYIFEYRVVTSKVLEPTDVSALQTTADARVTLTTCTPKYSARYRLDVQGVLAKITPRQKPTIVRRIVQFIAPPKPEEEPVPQRALDLALFDARREVKENPRSASAHIVLGVVYRKMNREADAIEEFQKAIELNPQASQAYYELALTHEDSKPQKALEELQKALNIDPNFEWAYFKLGELYLAQENSSEAINTFQKAVELSPIAGDSHYYLALAYEKAGYFDLAIAHYQEALKYLPDYKEAKEGLKRVQGEAE